MPVLEAADRKLWCRCKLSQDLHTPFEWSRILCPFSIEISIKLVVCLNLEMVHKDTNHKSPWIFHDFFLQNFKFVLALLGMISQAGHWMWDRIGKRMRNRRVREGGGAQSWGREGDAGGLHAWRICAPLHWVCKQRKFARDPGYLLLVATLPCNSHIHYTLHHFWAQILKACRKQKFKINGDTDAISGQWSWIFKSTTELEQKDK